MNFNSSNYAEIEAQVRKSLKLDYEAVERITLRADELESMCIIAITALMDHSPILGQLLLNKAEAVFGKNLGVK